MEASSKTGFHWRLSKPKPRSLPLSISIWVSSTPFLDLPLFLTAAISKFEVSQQYSTRSLGILKNQTHTHKKKKKKKQRERLKRILRWVTKIQTRKKKERKKENKEIRLKKQKYTSSGEKFNTQIRILVKESKKQKDQVKESGGFDLKIYSDWSKKRNRIRKSVVSWVTHLKFLNWNQLSERVAKAKNRWYDPRRCQLVRASKLVFCALRNFECENQGRSREPELLSLFFYFFAYFGFWELRMYDRQGKVGGL